MNVEQPKLIQATSTSAYNVIAGFLGVPIPPAPKQRNRTRAGYRKTERRQEHQQLKLAA